MDEIKVGEYVRLKSGLIGQFYNIEEGYDGNIQINFEEFGYEYENIEQFYDDIKKHSKNIIDLIEENDIVGYTINYLSEFKVGRVKKYKDARSDKQYLGVEGFDITKMYIEEILTKEQYEKNCYRLENN